MADKCPYCYRPLETWTHDPILLPHGAEYDWISDTELVYEPDEDNRWYKGFQQITEDEVIEIQDELKDLELLYIAEVDRTNFSPLNTSGKFQITGNHIKEMRDSVEKLLDATGMTKTDYFNYDEENNHIIHPLGDKIEWIDPITEATDLQKFQIKYIHIEDLRHYIRGFWEELWNYDGIHPVKNVTESWSPDTSEPYHNWSYDFNQESIYGTNVWNYTGSFNDHYGLFASYGSSYTHGSINYSFVQNPIPLAGTLYLSATAQSSIDIQPIGFYARTTYLNKFTTSLSRTFGRNTKIQITGVAKSGSYTSGGYWIALKLNTIFRKKTLISISPNTYSYTDLDFPIVLIDYVGAPFSPYGGMNPFGEGEYYVFGGELYVYPTIPQVILKHWYGFSNIDSKLVDVYNYQYEGIESIVEPIVIGESCIYSIWIDSIDLSTVVFSDTPSSTPGPASNTTSVTWLVDNIKLTI